ncbi:hypothetical protein C1645_184372 [Glomus cerebriforme]|uniref:RRM domain-containing protein n=1 Tax=Glomus cerebriforme TaxID=658196 RepID=A0A397T0J0_9GLOM|nr:hypothetical protein C1645_184372 [Glomus cerebriforme]
MVNKLTKNVTDAHLQEIFGAFGRIHRVEMALDDKWQTNKGIAYIDYETRVEAERAISYMDGGQLDGSFLSCTFVPRRPLSPLPPRRRAIVLVVDLHCAAIRDPDQEHQFVEDVHIHIVRIVRGVDQDHPIPEVVVEVIRQGVDQEAAVEAEVVVVIEFLGSDIYLLFFFLIFSFFTITRYFFFCLFFFVIILFMLKKFSKFYNPFFLL